MKASVINHVKSDEMLVIRKSFLGICMVNGPNGEIDAAASRNAGILLSYFEYWHNVKLAMTKKARALNDVAERHGDSRSRDETLLQFHTTGDILSECLGTISVKGIRSGRKALIKLGFISEHKNPHPRYKFDNTVFFMLHPDAVNKALSSYQNDRTILSKRPDDPIKTTGTSTETTAEATKETTIKNKNAGGCACVHKDNTAVAKQGEAETPNPQPPSPAKSLEEVIISFNLSLERRAALDLWLEYKREKRQGYKTIGLAALLKRWGDKSDAEFVEAIDNSMAANYVGLYEPRGKKQSSGIVCSEDI